MNDVYIAAVGLIPFARYPELGIKDLTKLVFADLIQRGPVTAKDIETAWFSNAGWGMQTGQHCIRGQVALSAVGVGEIPIMNVENACAGGASAFHGAWLDVASGGFDVALAIGVEKTFVAKDADPETKRKGFEGFLAATDVEVTKKLIAALTEEADRKRKELEESGEVAKSGNGARSPFMDLYSMAARAHMERHGSTQEQLAIIAAKNHVNGSLNPHAQYRFAMTPAEVLADRLVSWPLTRAMCAPMGDGAAAAILVSGDALSRFPGVRPVKVRASVVASGSLERSDGSRRASTRAYELAGVGPEDVDTAEVHDATAFGELAQTETLGFCDAGDGGAYAASGATSLGGAKPINTSGGLECRGHPIGASGLAQIAEIVFQLTGDGGDRQVEGARIGLTENGGGFLGTGEAAVSVHIFEGPS